MKHSTLSAIRTGLFVIAGIVAAAMPAAAQAQGPAQRQGPPSANGLWEQVDDDGRVGGWFHIYERDGVYEGKIVKMFPKPGDPVNPICTRCPGDQKNQPSLGLTLIKGMQRKGLSFTNGSILDPRDGNVYNARMDLSPDGQRLMMRGYLGIEMFGQTQTWRRLPESAMAEIKPAGNGAPAPAPASAPRPAAPKGAAPALRQ